MAINLLNDSESIVLLDENNILIDLKNQVGVLLYISYTKGDETSLSITYSVDENDIDDGSLFYNVVERGSDGNLVAFASNLTESANIVYPLSIAMPNNKVKVTFNFVGSIGSEGTISVFCKEDNISY